MTCINSISSGEFLKHPQEKYAAFLLHQIRKDLRVTEVWNEHIECYTGLGTLEIYNILKDCRRKVVSGVPNYKRLEVKTSASISKNNSNTSISTIGSNSGMKVISATPSPAIARMNTLLRSASVKSKLLAKPYRGIIFA